jgi:hypothetical protein
MEPAQRARWIQLGVLGVVLVAVVYFVLVPALVTQTAPGGQVAAAGGRTAASQTSRPIDVRLDALGKPAPPQDPEASRRNPFRMGAATPPPAPEGSAARLPAKPANPVAPVPTGPPAPPPVPPIPYRFIGVLSGVPGQGRIAVLTDGKTVVHGTVNAVIEGRYRIVQIGEESLQIEHADGRGRQTIRLLGQ